MSDFLDTRNSRMQRSLEEISQHKELPVQEVLRKIGIFGFEGFLVIQFKYGAR